MKSNVIISPKVAERLRGKIDEPFETTFIPISATELLWKEALRDIYKSVNCSLSTQFLENGLVHFQLWSSNRITLAIYDELKRKDYIVWNNIFNCGYLLFHIERNSFSIIINDIISLIATAHSSSKLRLEFLHRALISIFSKEYNRRYGWTYYDE